MTRLPFPKFHHPPRKCFSRKVIRAGNVFEVYRYEEPVLLGSASRIGRGGAIHTTVEVKQDNRRKTASRARQTVIRTINANPELNKFLTLTFAQNVTDIDYARKEFALFVKRITYHYGKTEYVCVIEFQKRGAIHFHLLCDLPYVDVNELAKLWGHGFVKLNRIDDVQNVGAYVSKYMTKESMDERLIGRKCYTMSKGLRSPEVITDEREIEAVLADVADVAEVYTASYESEYYGTVTYTRITCRRHPSEPRSNRKSRNRGTGASPCIQPKRRS